MLILKSERKRLILERLAEVDYVTLEELTLLLESSESTVRRDLDELETERKLRRIHGGAESIHPLRTELSNFQKSIKNVHEKERLAQRALKEISSDDVIFIDAGTTTAILVEQLTDDSLTVVTNSVHHASLLVEKGIKTIIIGGFVKESTDASVGQVTLEQISHLNFDKAFIGMNGINETFLTTPDFEEAMVKQGIIRNAKETFVLADRSKLGQVSFVKVAPVEDVTIITERSNKELISILKGKTRVIEI